MESANEREWTQMMIRDHGRETATLRRWMKGQLLG